MGSDAAPNRTNGLDPMGLVCLGLPGPMAGEMIGFTSGIYGPSYVSRSSPIIPEPERPRRRRLRTGYRWVISRPGNTTGRCNQLSEVYSSLPETPFSAVRSSR